MKQFIEFFYFYFVYSDPNSQNIKWNNLCFLFLAGLLIAGIVGCGFSNRQKIQET